MYAGFYRPGNLAQSWSAWLYSYRHSDDYGGSGGTFAHEAILATELCLAGDSSWRAGKQIHTIANHYIARYGTEAQRQQYLPGLASGELIAAMGMAEPNEGTDLKNMRTKAKRESDGSYRINGAKGVSLFIFDTQTPGFRVGQCLKKLACTVQTPANCFFDNSIVSADALLGAIEGRAFYQMMQDLTYERTLTGVNCAAIMEFAFHQARGYSQERNIFDGKLIDLQNTRSELA